jgi:DNA-binding transcriptional MerR regulator
MTLIQRADGEGANFAGSRQTVEEFARSVGMSPRNVRAHQARGLLSQPIRVGRVAYYDETHTRRIEAIQDLQRQGFNLVSIASILGVRESPPGPAAPNFERFWLDHPALTQALIRHGALSRSVDGTVQVVRPRLLRAALSLRQMGLSSIVALQVLVEAMDRIRVQADDLVQVMGTRVLATLPVGQAEELCSWEELDREIVSLTQIMTALLSEGFLTAVMHSSEQHLADLVAQRSGVAFPTAQVCAVDVG